MLVPFWALADPSFAQRAAGAQLARVLVGQTGLDSSATDLAGKPVRLSDFRA